MKLSKILITNRGEIAVRVITACKEAGIKSVAVYSEADAEARHVLEADESYLLGPPPASESYLKQDDILRIAIESNCDAIHPGYGFLAENADFADKARENGILFIGPPAEAIRTMGEKTIARKIMQDAGVPVVPGTVEPLADYEEAIDVAEKIGYPVLIKASGGGGGKGMRRVATPDGLKEGYERAVSEATASFSNSAVYIEKYLENPRHIEFQILADEHGNIIHLGERECSIQRRHQKVVEECPSSLLTSEEREQFGKIAVQAARACNYTNAGTVEFLMDKHRNFYFLEMNTRLQVEHPVTEMVTGIDIVQEQFRISEGKPLSFTQDQVKLSGHAIECRVYAEDPLNDFYPSIGLISHLKRPQGAGIRIDSGVESGSEISIYYDPLIAKLVCYGKDRNAAIQRSIDALSDYTVFGVITNIPFCRYVLEHDKFKSGNFDTNFVDDFYKPENLNTFDLAEKAAIAASAAYMRHKSRETESTLKTEVMSPWKLNGIRDAMR